MFRHSKVDYDFFESPAYPTIKKGKKKKRQQHVDTLESNHLELKKITSKTPNQNLVFSHFDQGRHLVLNGMAGTGKTFISMYLALREIYDAKASKLYIVRSILSARDIGFLPGNLNEKAKIYETPYRDICVELFSRGDSYELLKSKGMVEFVTTSFLRGTTLRNGIILIDEAQNMTSQELSTIMTRVGDNSRVLICGDYFQSDLEKEKDRRGILDLLKITQRMNLFKTVEFQVEDIVRSRFVREFLIAKRELKL